MGRDEDILATDRALEAGCDVDRYRARGPGGQHRNKTESAIRLRHRATGVVVHADERRSQHENHAQALERLREALALTVRLPVEPGAAPSARLAALIAGGTAPLGERTRRKPEFLVAFAELLDVFVLCDCEVARTAERFGVSTGAMSKLLLVSDHTSRAVNQLRTQRGLRPLR